MIKQFRIVMNKLILTTIVILIMMFIIILTTGQDFDIHRLPDGVGTNGVVAEVPRFPLRNFTDRCEQPVTTYDSM